MRDTGFSQRQWGQVVMTGMLVGLCLIPSLVTARSAPVAIALSASRTNTDIAARYGALPLALEENTGQAEADARFVAHGSGFALTLTRDALTLAMNRPDPVGGQRTAPGNASAIRLAFARANPAPTLVAEQPLPGVANYLIGNDPSRWRTNVPTSARVRYADLYSGIDLTVYGTEGGGSFEYDAVVAPGADHTAFALAISGVDAVTIDAATGDLVLTTATGDVRQHPPVAYQERDGTRLPVDAGYDLRAEGTVGFRVGAYDGTLPLVIDPQVMPAFSTYLGGNRVDAGYGIAVDTSGNAYITGSTNSTNFPVTNGSTYGSDIYGSNAFVTKLNASGTRVYSTYLGGNGQDAGYGIAVDTSGSAYITGIASSTNFPVTNGSTLYGAGGTGGGAFLTELDASGARTYSTYFGGSSQTQGAGIAVDASGNIWVTGYTESTDFPVTNGSTRSGTRDAFVMKLNTSKMRIYSIYLGGSGSDAGDGIAVDASGNASITGYTLSTNFPVTNSSTFGGLQDAFVVKLNASGVVYSTYLGGSGYDTGYGIGVDTSGNAYITGSTSSTNFPVTNGSTRSGSSTNAFVTKLNTSGTRVFSTYLGGNGGDGGSAIAVDASGNAYVTGSTQSTDFPVTNGSTFGGGSNGGDTFVTKLNASGVRVYSTYLGGSSDDAGFGIAVDISGSAWVTGKTSSTNFPVTNGSTFGGFENVFVTKLTIASPPPPTATPNSQPARHPSVATTVATQRTQPTSKPTVQSVAPTPRPQPAGH